MANEEHLAILKQGVEVWNKWREENPEIGPDLSGTLHINRRLLDAAIRDGDFYLPKFILTNLYGRNLGGVNLSRTNLSSTNLRYANLNKADLHDANLTDANLTEAKLNGANLSRTNLRNVDLGKADLHEAKLNGANLSEINLERANLYRTNLSGANLDNARLGFTLFNDLDLSTIKKLETVKHAGPSHIDILTIYKSKGNIPEAFLRGCGIPDIFIEYMASLVGEAIEYYSCFISYSSKDAALAEGLHADLQNNGVRCWYAPHDLTIGERIRVGIDEAIRFHDKLLLILSQDSVGSDWVEHEVETAMEKERSQGQLVLFPIRIDDAAMNIPTGWAAHIRRTRNIGDFRKWKNHDAYQKEFQRLLRDLKTDQKAPMPPAIFTETHHPPHALELDEERIKLKNVLVEHFNDNELRDLYDDLNVDYENVPGETKSDKARELVAYFERHRPGGVATLAEYVRDKRPNAFG